MAGRGPRTHFDDHPGEPKLIPVYPALATGAYAQFPICKRTVVRTVKNAMPGGQTIKAADPGAGCTKWSLRYADITDEERGSLEEFFRSVEGRLKPFVFVDPTANLIGWSERLDEAVWEKGLVLSLSKTNVAAGVQSWLLENNGAGSQRFEQTVPAPAGLTYTFSALIRPVSGKASMFAGGDKRPVTGDSGWTKAAITTSPGGDGPGL